MNVHANPQSLSNFNFSTKSDSGFSSPLSSSTNRLEERAVIVSRGREINLVNLLFHYDYENIGNRVLKYLFSKDVRTLREVCTEMDSMLTQKVVFDLRTEPINFRSILPEEAPESRQQPNVSESVRTVVKATVPVSDREVFNRYKNEVGDDVLQLIVKAEKKKPEERISQYTKAWELAEKNKDWPGIVYSLIKRGDACLENNVKGGDDLEGLVNRWRNQYSLAARFYAAARVKAEEYKCGETFATNLFQERLNRAIIHFIKQECKWIKGVLTLDHVSYVIKLHEVRDTARKMLEDLNCNAKELLASITNKFRGIIVDILPECVAIMGKAPCKYAVVGLGSMSRNEMGPFSDIELAIILEKSDSEIKDYFYRLMCLFEFKIISIGETELPRTLGIDLKNGFGIDVGGNTPTCKLELLGTCEELVNQQTPVNKGGDIITLNALRTVCFVYGNEDLVISYRQKLTMRLDERYSISKTNSATRSIREGRAIQLFQGDIYDFEPVLGGKKEKESFNVKKELYRLPSNLVNYLALYYGIDGQSSWDKLEKLVEGGFMIKASRQNIAGLLEFSTKMRVKTHLFYGCEKEDIYHKRLLDDEKGLKRPLGVYEISDEEQKQLEMCYRVLIPIHKGIKDFVDKKDPKDFRQLALYEDSLYVQGEIASKMLRYREAAEMYEKSLSLDPENVEILSALGQNKVILIDKDALAFMEHTLKVVIKKCGESHPEVGACYSNIGNILRDRGKYTEAMEYFTKALAISKQVYGKKHPVVAITYNNIGSVLKAEGKYAEAIEHCLKALVIFERICGKKHPKVATTHNNIGVILEAQGKYAEAMVYFTEALAISEKIYDKNHPGIDIYYGNIGNILRIQEKHLEAMEYYFKALAVSEKVYDKDHPNTSICHNNIGNALEAQGKHAEAMEYYLEALAIREQLLGKDHPDIVTCYTNIGVALRNEGQYVEAMGYFTQALAISEKAHGKDHPNVATCYDCIGSVLKAQGNYAEAMEYFTQALTIKKQVHGKQHPVVATSYNNMGDILKAQGKYAEAMECCLEALVISESFYGKDHPVVATSYSNIGVALGTQGNNAEAIEYYIKAAAIYKNVYGKDHPDLATCYNNIGKALYEQGMYKEAMEYFFKALTVREQLYGNNHTDIAACYNDIGEALYAKGERKEAIEYIAKALTIREQLLGKDHPDLATSYNNASVMLCAQGKYKESMEYLLKALAIRKKVYGTEHPHTVQLIDYLNYLKSLLETVNHMNLLVQDVNSSRISRERARKTEDKNVCLII